MTNFFSGLPVGGRVTIRLTRTDTATFLEQDVSQYGVPPVTTGPNASFSIVINRAFTNAVSPYPVIFEASSFVGFRDRSNAPLSEPSGNTNVDDRTQKDIFYFWDFGDPDYTPKVTPNIPTVWRNLNVSYGKIAAHVYTAPGTYTVTCHAFDTQGNWGVATFSVTVANPDTFFAGNRTIYFNPPGDSVYPGAIGGSTQTNTASTANSAISAAPAGMVRVLFKRGATYTNPAPLGQRNRSVFYGTYGTGADPIIDITAGSGFVQLRDSEEGIVSDFDFRGAYDAGKDVGRDASIFGGSSPTFVKRFAAIRCKFTGGPNPVPWPNNQATDGLQFMPVFDCSITNWRDYGMAWQDLDGIVIVGCDVFQKDNALAGQRGATGDQSAEYFLGVPHGPYRTGINYLTIMDAVSLFSRAGWVGFTDGTTTLPSADQGCVRWWNTFPSNPAATPQLRHKHHWGRITMEGGDGVCTFANGQVPQNLAPRNFVMDKFIIAGTTRSFSSNGLIGGDQAGTVLRNGYLYRGTRGLVLTPNRPDSEINLKGGTIAGLPANEVYNLTILSQMPSGSYNPLTPILLTGTTAGTQVNNVIVIPNRGFPLSTWAPLGISAIEGFALRDKGTRWNFPLASGRVLGLYTCVDRRENPASPGTLQPGTVANGEWMVFPYPDYTGYCRGANANGPFTAQLTQAQVLANSTQYHQVSYGIALTTTAGVSVPRSRLAPASAGGPGFCEFEFYSTYYRIRNLTGFPIPSGVQMMIQLDLSDYLMDFVANTGQFDETVPLPRPLAGSSALSTGSTQPRSFADFFGTRKPGSLTNTGTFVPGSASQGAFEPV
jgi:hypothetical protein